MSVTSALFTGVSGLLGNAEAINVIGNNLSNVNTVGFKSGRMLFSDALSVSIANNSQIGRGSQIQSVDTVFSQGSFENSEVVTDIAIQGNSFFALKTAAQPTPLTSQASATLTRAGAFRLDASKFLVNPDGYQVVDTSGNGIQFTANSAAIQSALTATIDPVTVAAGTMAAATDAAMYLTPMTTALTGFAPRAIDALTSAKTGLAAAKAASAAATLSGDPASITAAAAAMASANAAVTAANNLVTLSTTATTNANAAIAASSALVAAAANLSANPNDANANTASAANTTAYSALNSARTSMNALEQAFAEAATALDDTANTAGAGYDLDQLSQALATYAATVPGTTAETAANAASAAAATASADLITAATDATTASADVATAVTATDASLTTANNDNTAADTAFGIFRDASGAAFSKVSKIEADGLMTYVGKYGDTYYYDKTNAIGIPTATATVAQMAACQRIAIVNPSNPGAMEKLGGSLYKINTFSGVQTSGFSVSDNKINGTTEKFFSNQLESSNVDMAAQFVKMILTQRAYSANSKTITTADEMTQEVLNLKR